MELNVFAPEKTDNKTIQVSDLTFGSPYNEPLVHQVVVAYLAGGRAGTKAQKTRAEVRGGGIKPWRQKGTGRARAGSIRSPIWRKGGKTFAAEPRDYKQKVNRKMYRAAMRSILSELARQERLLIVEEFLMQTPKTRELVQKLKTFQIESALIISEPMDDNLILAARNLFKIHLCEAGEINPANLMAFNHVVMTVNALKQIEEALQ